MQFLLKAIFFKAFNFLIIYLNVLDYFFFFFLLLTIYIYMAILFNVLGSACLRSPCVLDYKGW